MLHHATRILGEATSRSSKKVSFKGVSAGDKEERGEERSLSNPVSGLTWERDRNTGAAATTRHGAAGGVDSADSCVGFGMARTAASVEVAVDEVGSGVRDRMGRSLVPRLQAQRVGEIRRIAVDVRIRRSGFVDRRINGEELAGGGIVVAPNSRVTRARGIGSTEPCAYAEWLKSVGLVGGYYDVGCAWVRPVACPGRVSDVATNVATFARLRSWLVLNAAVGSLRLFCPMLRACARRRVTFRCTSMRRAGWALRRRRGASARTADPRR